MVQQAQQMGGVAGPAGPALAGPLFSKSLIGLVPRLHAEGQSEDETIGPGVQRKHAFALTRTCFS